MLLTHRGTSVSGNVKGPSSSTDNAVARFDGTTGKTLLNSVPTITDEGGMALSSAYAIGTTPTEAKGLVLRNSTAAALGAQQYSPSIYLAGQGWATAGSSQECLWRITGIPVQGVAAPSTSLAFQVSIAGGAYASPLYIQQGGIYISGAVGTTSSVYCDIDGAGNVGYSASTGRYANAYLTTSLNLANGTAILTTTDLTFSAATTAVITGSEADGGTAIGVKLNTSATYSTAGAKLLSVQNNGTEKGYLDKDGLLRVASSIRVAGDIGSGEAGTVTFTDVVDAAGDTGAVLGNWRVNGSAGVFHGWLKYWDGTTYVSIPTWKAA